MADALLSTVLEQLGSIIAREAEQELSLVTGVEGEVEKLKSNLQAIQAVLADAERRQLKEAAVRQWLAKLKNISYDIDDVLDEWSTAILRSQTEGDQYSSKSKKMVCSFFSSPCLCCKRVVQRRDIAVKIKDLNDRLDAISKEKSNFNFTSMSITEKVERSSTTSDINITEVRGRENEKNAILGIMLSESSQKPNFHLISIVGMGGIGKTTLARLVYNENKVHDFFEDKMWVCVSDPFDEIRVAKAILESLMGKSSDLVELQTIVQSIKRLIKGKRFLLVLDDVWTEDSKKWEQLKHSLMCGLPGSTILVTTRKENVAISMGCISENTFRLGQLSSEECWSVFSQDAFFGKSAREREQLEVIGRKIVDRCKGLPLAAKTLGGLLRFRKFREEWQSVLDSEMWELEEAERDIFAPLLLSYYDLPSALKRCFTYCAVFPKDHLIEKDRLIELWMAQNYLKATGNKDMEVVGEEYFQNLAVRSLFQDFEKDKSDGSITKCKMHDMVHDFVQYLTKDECFSTEVYGHEESKVEPFNREARHAMVVIGGRNVPIPSPIYSLKNLHSLLIESSGYESIIGAKLSNLFDESTCLRSLRLRNCGFMEIPSNINNLIPLRLLDLSATSVGKLPETVCELYNLQTLNVFGCHNLELPNGIGKLINLRHLLNYQFRALNMFLPKGLGNLTSLRTLTVLHVRSDDRAASLSDLKNLDQLRGSFSILGLDKVTDVEDAKQAQLKKKKHITKLELWFGSEEEASTERICRDKKVIEALESPPNVEYLDITRYAGDLLPSWIVSLTNVRRINLSYCRKCKQLLPLGKLPFLEHLSIGHMDSVEKVSIDFLGMERSSSAVAFQRLIELHFYNMKKWEEWEDIGNTGEDPTNITAMPCLQSLQLFECPKLKSLPHYLFRTTTLNELRIDLCGDLGDRYKRIGEDWSKICHIPNIRINFQDEQGGDKDSQNQATNVTASASGGGSHYQMPIRGFPRNRDHGYGGGLGPFICEIDSD